MNRTLRSKFDTEEELIRAAQLDPKYFEIFYEEYFADIFRFVLKRVNDKEVAADLTQQTFMNALLNIKKFKYRGLPFSAYLYRAAINESNSYFRKTGKVRYVSASTSDFESLSEEINSDDHLEHNLKKLSETIKQLKTEEIQLLELRFFEKYSFREIGFVLRISETLARVKTFRLLSKMKKMML